MSGPYFIPIVFQIAGIVTIIAEIFLPSGGILSLIAGGLFLVALVKAFAISTNVGMAFIGADIVLIPVMVLIGLKLIAKSPVTLRKELSRKDGVFSQKKDMESFLNASGVTLTAFRPAGAVKLNNQRIDAVTQGEYLEKGTPVRVIQVTGNQVIVEAKK